MRKACDRAKISFVLALSGMCVLLLAAAGARAEPGVEHVRIVAAESAHGPEPFLAGVWMSLVPGWKTYWRFPGDSGLAPHFDWSGSRNVASLDLEWSVPERFDAPGDTTFGYKDEVVWPVRVRPADPAEPVELRLVFFYGVCSSVCVPGEAKLALDIPASRTGQPVAAPEAALIRHYLARVPGPPADEGMLAARALRDGTPRLEVIYRGAAETDVPALIVEGPDGFWFGTPHAARENGVLRYVVPVEIEGGKTLQGMKVTLTLSGPQTAIEAVRTVE